VELASSLAAEYGVETVGPVDTHHTHHRQIDAQTGTGAAFELERREIAHRSPGIAALCKHQSVDCGGGLKHEREVQLHTETRISIAVFAVGSQRTVVVTAQRYCLGGVGILSAHAVTAHIERLER